MVTSSERLPTHGPIAPTIPRELNGVLTEAILGLPRPTLSSTGIGWNRHLVLFGGRATLTRVALGTAKGSRLRTSCYPQSGSAVGESFGWGAKEERLPSQKREPMEPCGTGLRERNEAPRARETLETRCRPC